jgi:hypothetical protein
VGFSMFLFLFLPFAILFVRCPSLHVASAFLHHPASMELPVHGFGQQLVITVRICNMTVR